MVARQGGNRDNVAHSYGCHCMAKCGLPSGFVAIKGEHPRLAVQRD
jgi:hypothetical protein